MQIASFAYLLKKNQKKKKKSEKKKKKKKNLEKFEKYFNVVCWKFYPQC